MVNSSLSGSDDKDLKRYFDFMPVEAGISDFLNKEDELKLIKRVQAGDRKALGTLVKYNIRFVVKIALGYASSKIDLVDLISEGNMGLIVAAKKYDVNRDVKFLTYAVWWVRKSILGYIKNHSRNIRLPSNKYKNISDYRRALVTLEQTNEGVVSLSDISEILKVSEEEVLKYKALSEPECSIENISVEDEYNISMLENNLDSTFDDIEIEGISTQSIRDNLNIIFKYLSKIEIEIISLYYGLNTSDTLTLNDIGIELNISRERVRQVRDNALRKLKKGLKLREMSFI